MMKKIKILLVSVLAVSLIAATGRIDTEPQFDGKFSAIKAFFPKSGKFYSEQQIIKSSNAHVRAIRRF